MFDLVGPLTIKLVVGFFVLFFFTKITGKTQISQLTPFDFISSIVLSELLGNALYDNKINLLIVVYAFLIWGGLQYISEILGQKFLKWRGFFEGNPSIIIRDGMIDRNELKKNKMNLNQLLNLLRHKDVFWLGDIKYAIIEPDGALSILKQSNAQKPTRQDLNLAPLPVNLPIILISDGVVMPENLKATGHDLQWLKNLLSQQGITDEGEIFCAQWQQDKGLYITKK